MNQQRLKDRGSSWGRFAWAALLFVAVWGVQTHTAGVRKVTIEEAARTADAVFAGTVVDAQPRWGEGGKLIWTDYTFRVHETWKGAPGEVLRTVSVGGGSIGERSFLLSEVPEFEKGGTYVVYAYDNARLIAEGVVGVDQGLFREVTDAGTGRTFLIDAHGYRMEQREDGCIVRGRLTRRVGDTQSAHVLTDEELVGQQEAFLRENDPVPVPPPVIRDSAGNILPTDPYPARTPKERALGQMRDAPQGAALTREALREFTLKVLGLQEPVPQPAPAGREGGK